MSLIDQKRDVEQFADILEANGLWTALQFLNSTTDHRYTGVYRFEGGALKNLSLFDRESPTTRNAPDVDVSLSYCSLMIGTGEPLQLADALHDARTTTHPSREVVRAYCGIPLMDEDGRVLGSLCHFSLLPALVYDRDVELLLELPAILRLRGLDPALLSTWRSAPGNGKGKIG